MAETEVEFEQLVLTEQELRIALNKAFNAGFVQAHSGHENKELVLGWLEEAFPKRQVQVTNIVTYIKAGHKTRELVRKHK